MALWLANKHASPPAIIATEVKIHTVFFWEKPACNSLWWMCSASATKGDWPLHILLKLAQVMSIIGTANTTKGNKIASVATFITPVIDIVASKNPENRVPLSPINIFAGLKLNVKNASIEPARIKPINALIGLGGQTVIAKIARVMALTVTTEPASPSTPSIKFKAFEIPTIHKSVIGYDNHPKSKPPKNGTLFI